MSTKFLSAIIALIIAHITTSSAFPSTRTEKDVKRRAQIKEQVVKRGTGEKSRIRVKMLDGKTLKGFIEEAGAEAFVLRESGNWKPQTIPYADVAQIKDKEASASQKILFTLVILTIAGAILSRGNS